MKPYTRSILELFDGKKRFLIPRYQRKYKWKPDPQLNLLWEDIIHSANCLIEDKSIVTPHFMGAMVIAQVKTFGKQVQAFEVIDGQQRLTTFQLLLAALRDIAKENKSRYGDEIQKYLINDGIMEEPEKESFKLWPSTIDRQSFKSIIGLDIEKESASCSVDAHTFFKDKIKNYISNGGLFDEHKLEILFESLKNGLAIVSIELEAGDDPQTIFETLNSRGVALSASDLMRNFIFQRAKGLGQEDSSLVIDKLYEKYWEPLDCKFWSHSQSRGRQKSNRLNWMLTDHLAMLTGDVISIENLFERYRRWILNSQRFITIEMELEAISLTAAIEMRLFSQNRSDPIGNFGYFSEAFDVSTAMPLIIYLATEANIGEGLMQCLNMLESFILRRDICGLTTKAYNRFFIGIIDRLRNEVGSKVDALLQYLSSRTSDIDRWPDDDEWKRCWLERSQYKNSRTERIVYILEAIELAMRSRRSEDITIRSKLTIEHVMPQKWEKNWPLDNFEHLDEKQKDLDVDYQFAKKVRNDIIHSLGNLTLLTQSLNTSISNDSYSVKMPELQSHSSLALNRELSNFNEWNEATIVARGNDLYDIAKNIWMAPLKISV